MRSILPRTERSAAIDRQAYARVIAALSDTEYLSSAQVAERCGLSIPVVNKILPNLGSNVVEWIMGRSARVRRTHHTDHGGMFK